jgi:CubicO group peptidase (beta-lactamase class C family)
VRQALLACGVLSSLLYIATDIIGGLRYQGYSFTSQTISELTAIGAPTRAFVERLYLPFELLALAFAVGVIWTAVGQGRALKITAAFLLAYVVIGWVGFALSPMHQRGESTLANDLPHALVAGVVVLLLLFTIAAGAFALGKRFRIYSLATLLTMLVFSALTFPAAPRIAANLPTPGIGIYERIDVYAPMLWLAVLAIALMQRRRSGAAVVNATSVMSHGFVAAGFEEVRHEFERNFAERGEIGAAVAADWGGAKMVYILGGKRAPNGDDPWNEDTMVVVNSTTKGLSAMTLALANARGWLDYDAPVVRYWPEFAQNGKAVVTVRQLLGHEAGLVLLDEELTLEKLSDLDYVAAVLARQKPAWPPGTRHGYHTMTIGLYMQELIRRVDPAHRTLGRFFHEEVATPLDLEFYIGLPKEIPDQRLARLETLSPWRGLLALRYTPAAVTMKMITPGSLLRRSFVGLSVDPNDRGYLNLEVPAGNGVGTARAIARAYSCFAEGGAELGLTPETLARVTSPPVMAGPRDVVLGLPSYFSLGFLRPGPNVDFGSSERAFGAPGAGGSFAFADPDARLGYAYVMNKMDFYLTDDPREKPLRDALYRAVRRLPAQERLERASAVSRRSNCGVASAISSFRAPEPRADGQARQTPADGIRHSGGVSHGATARHGLIVPDRGSPRT